MSLDLDASAPPSSRPLYRLIRQTRFLLRVTHVGMGLALTVGLFLGALALATAGDLLLPLLQIPFSIAINLDSGVRLASLVLVILPSAAALLIGVVFPLFRRFSAGYVARLIEAHIPGIHNRLVSCIDLEAGGRAPASPVFYCRLLTESLDRIHGFQPRRVLDFVKLRRAGLIAATGTLAFTVVYCFFWQNLPTALARIFHPLEDIPPVAGVAYLVEPEGGAFLREDKVQFTARLTRGETDALSLTLRAENGAARVMPLEPVHAAAALFALQLDTVSIGQAYQNGFHYRVHGGGTWSPRYEVRLVERPLITNVDTSVYYPAYMAIPEGRPTPREAAEIIGPEGGEIEVVVQAEGQVAFGEIQLLTPPETGAPTYRVAKTFPMHLEKTGRWAGRLPLVDKGLFRVEMCNKEGHANKPMAELRFKAVKDEPPQVVLQRPGRELTPSEPQAAPLTVAAFNKMQDALLDRLLKLQAEQTKVQETVGELNQQAAKPLDELKKQLADLAQKENKNAEDASHLNHDLTKANADAEKSQILPPVVAAEVKAIQKTFEQTAVQTMNKLGEQFDQDANPQSGAPDLSNLKKQADLLAKDLEGVKERLEARAARQRLHKDEATESPQSPKPSQSEAVQSGGSPPVGAADLSKLRPAAREAVMKLPPRVREELLQGLREQGPEGYGLFVEDYFKRVMETKTP